MWPSVLPLFCLLNWRLRLLAPSLSFHPKFYHHSGRFQKPTLAFQLPDMLISHWKFYFMLLQPPNPTAGPQILHPKSWIQAFCGYHLLSSQLTINIFNLFGMSSPWVFSLNLLCLSFPFNVSEISWSISGSCRGPKYSPFFLLYTDSKTLSKWVQILLFSIPG